MSFHTLDEQPPYMVPLRRARFATPENPANSPPFRLHAGDTLSMAETDEATVSTITNVINNIVPTAVNNDAGSNSVTPVGDPFTPGDAVTPGGSAAYTSRSRGGTATLIGFSEYSTPSTPAKKYLTKTLSGNVTVGIYLDSSCTTPLTISTIGVTTNIAMPGGGYVHITPSSSSAFTYSFSGISTNGLPWRDYGGFDITGQSGYAATHRSPLVASAGTFVVGAGKYPLTITSVHQKNLPGGGTGFETGASASVGITEDKADTLTYSGEDSFDATTSAETNTGAVNGTTYSSSAVPTTVSSTVTSIGDAITRYGSGSFTDDYTTTTRALTPTSAITGPSGSPSAWRKVLSSSAAEALTSEDTDANAITRLMATSPSWSSWTATTLPGATASHAARTTGFSFAYNEAELKIVVAGFPAAFTFTLRAQIIRVDNVTSELTLAATQDYLTTTDGAGAATLTVGVTADSAGLNGATYQVYYVEWFHAAP